MKYKFATPDEYKLDTLKSAEEGTFITFYYQACSNVRIQSTLAPSIMLLDSPREYFHTTGQIIPVAVAFKVSLANLPLIKESLGKARIMQYDIVNEIYLVDNGYCEDRG